MSNSQVDFAKQMQFRFIVNNDPDLTYSLQGCNIANATLAETMFATGVKDVYIPDNKFTHDDLILMVLVSSDFREWINLYRWMILMKQSGDYTHTAQCELQVLTASNHHVLSFVYENCWPTALDGIQYSVNDDENRTISISTTIKFSSFSIKLPDGTEINEF